MCSLSFKVFMIGNSVNYGEQRNRCAVFCYNIDQICSEALLYGNLIIFVYDISNIYI